MISNHRVMGLIIMGTSGYITNKVYKRIEAYINVYVLVYTCRIFLLTGSTLLDHQRMPSRPPEDAQRMPR